MTQTVQREQDFQAQIADLEKKKKIAQLEHEIQVVRSPPDRVNTDASLDFSGTAKMIGGTLHDPKSYDAKLMHSHLEKIFLPDVMITSAVPFVMTKDEEFLKKDSLKAEAELAELERDRELDGVATVDNEEAMIEAIYELPEILDHWPDDLPLGKSRGELVIMDDKIQEVKLELAEQIQKLQGDYELMKKYSFANAILESRILTEDDILAWDVMTPFCESLPEKFLMGTMGVDGKRAEQAVQNIGSILTQQKQLAEAGAAKNIFSRGVDKAKKWLGSGD